MSLEQNNSTSKTEEIRCIGCGAVLQSTDEHEPGYLLLAPYRKSLVAKQKISTAKGVLDSGTTMKSCRFRLTMMIS